VSLTEVVRAEYRGTDAHFSTVLPTLTNTEMVAGISSAKGARSPSTRSMSTAAHEAVAAFDAGEAEGVCCGRRCQCHGEQNSGRIK
jgi:short-subunit dehydrogenase